jgi:virginiamycin B lyase
MLLEQLSSLGRSRAALLAGLVAVLLLGMVLMGRGNDAGNTATPPCGSSANSRPNPNGALTEYPLPHPQSALMSPAIDAQGNIWFGEMNGNRLGRLNPTTHTITEWQPPQSNHGIMSIAVDRHGMMWFAELTSDFVGRFDPATCQFHNVSTAVNGRAGGPTSITLAPDGKVWFTLQTADRVGVIDPATDALRTYAIPGQGGAVSIPYGIAVDQSGMVWLTELLGNAVDRLNPATGAVQRFPISQAQAEPNQIAIAPDGTVWFTEMSNGVLGMLAPTTGTISTYAPPTSFGNVAEFYGVQITAQGVAWVTSSGANSLLRFDTATHAWGAVRLPTIGSVPYGVVLGSKGAVWFTEGSLAANRVGVYHSS